MKNTRLDRNIFAGALTIASLLVAQHSANAGTRVGNGGGGWICRDPQGATRWIEVIDLFEQREEHRLSPDTSLSSNATGVQDGIDRLERKLEAFVSTLPANPSGAALGAVQFLNLFRAQRQQLLSSIDFIENGALLEPIDDSHIRVRPNPAQACAGGELRAIQIANTSPFNRLLIQRSLWEGSQFGISGQIGLISHEIVYAAFRHPSIGDEDSVRARRLNAYLLSDRPIESYVEYFTPFGAALALPGSQLPALTPNELGRYRSVTRADDHFDDLQITHFNLITGVIALSELPFQRRGGTNYHRFECRSDVRGFRCSLQSSSNARLYEKRRLHTLYIERGSPAQDPALVWERQLDGGAIRTVRYERVDPATPVPIR